MLAVGDEPSGDFFAVQRAFTFDEQDRDLGMDTYCLVRGEATHYGDLDSYEVTDSLLRLRFGAAAADALDLPAVTELAIDATEAETVRLRLPGLVSED